jgi:hypothetical protein
MLLSGVEVRFMPGMEIDSQRREVFLAAWESPVGGVIITSYRLGRAYPSLPSPPRK